MRKITAALKAIPRTASMSMPMHTSVESTTETLVPAGFEKVGE